MSFCRAFVVGVVVMHEVAGAGKTRVGSRDCWKLTTVSIPFHPSIVYMFIVFHVYICFDKDYSPVQDPLSAPGAERRAAKSIMRRIAQTIFFW